MQELRKKTRYSQRYYHIRKYDYLSFSIGDIFFDVRKNA